MDFTLRPARPEDAASIVAMARALTDYESALTPGAAPETCGLTEDTVQRHAFGAPALLHLIVAESGGALIGYLGYLVSFDTMVGAPGLWMADLYVAESARRRGVGKALMGALAIAARRHEATWVAWSVHGRNAAATAFYERYGERDPDPLFWTGLEDLERRVTG